LTGQPDRGFKTRSFLKTSLEYFDSLQQLIPIQKIDGYYSVRHAIGYFAIFENPGGRPGMDTGKGME